MGLFSLSNQNHPSTPSHQLKNPILRTLKFLGILYVTNNNTDDDDDDDIEARTQGPFTSKMCLKKREKKVGMVREKK